MVRRILEVSAYLKARPYWPRLPGLIVAVSLLSACAAPAGTITPAPTATASARATPVPASSLEPLATPTPLHVTVDPPPGLVYRTEDGIWRVGADGVAVLITDRVDVILSSDALRGTGPRQALFVRDIPETSDTDIWIIDLDTGEERNLTRDANRIECCPQWWPGPSPDAVNVILFGSWPQGADLGPSTGFLTAAAVDGSWYLVLDEQSQSNGMPAPAADGGTIAYDRAGTPWLYRWGAELEPLDPHLYGLSLAKSSRIASPAWAPDGKTMAWVVGGDFGQGWQIGIAVFDFEAQTSRLLHPYEPLGVGGWPSAPIWSPDGQWLAFYAGAQDPDEAGLWVVQVDGEAERFLGASSDPVWSPEGRRLIYSTASTFWIAEVLSWKTQQVDVPTDARPLAWVQLEQ